MHAETMAEIADDVSAARGALNDALQLAQRFLIEGLEGNGWLAELQRLYGEVNALEGAVQQAAEHKAAA